MFFVPILKYASASAFDKSIATLREHIARIVRTRLAGEQKESENKDLLGALIGQLKKYEDSEGEKFQ